ncbi:glycine zipper 2TM domain-containing protein [Novosphingobium sp. 9]|uniref:glycine zipper 2TM domain-containing protein n=1 Tax=Novosphingobium sp. 9 TaxID=2025349 RepID=UPI0021B57F8B|nr:glycine zipper 2TM domain-containing protein [Novosphingobium sp. 9]
MKKTLLALTMAAMAMPILPAAPAMARDHYHGRNEYDSHGRYRTPHRMGRNDHAWRGRDGRYYCRRDNGTTGLLIGAGVGALAGNAVAGRGDKTLGTVIGGVAGGLLGRSVDRGDLKCR